MAVYAAFNNTGATFVIISLPQHEEVKIFCKSTYGMIMSLKNKQSAN
jgi:hypothetical protein